MTSTAMPSLSSNRIALTRTPVPVGSPAPEIGRVVYVASDVDAEGYSTDPEFGPMVLWRRISLSLVVAIVAMGISWLVAMLALGGQSPGPAAGLAAVSTAFFTWLAWRGMGTTKRVGSCLYVGTDGVTEVSVKGTNRTTKTTLFRDDVVTVTAHASVSINGSYAYTLESITFQDGNGEFLQGVVATYKGRPSEHALAVRATIAAAGAKRAASAREKLARGEQVVFPIFSEIGKPERGEALLLDSQTLAYRKTATAQPLRVDRAAARLELRMGYLDLTAGSGMVIGTFERNRVGNYDVLSELVGTTG